MNPTVNIIGHKVFLTIGKQMFEVSTGYEPGEQEAEAAAQWYGEQLKKALNSFSATALEPLRLLRDLHDLQNGPPLEREREQWENTMKEVQNLLNKYNL